MANRFDSAGHVDHWRATGEFPRIHDQIAQAVIADVPAGRCIIDLGASTGLLARRLRDAGYRVIAVETSAAAVRRGVDSGVLEQDDYLVQRIAPSTIKVLDAALRDRVTGPAAVVARRVWPEMHDALGIEFDELPAMLARHADLMVSETRAESTRTRHPLGTAERENAALAGSWITRVDPRVAVFTHDRRPTT